MAARIYGFVCLFVAALAGGLYLTGYFNTPAAIIFGFIFATLVFTGLVGLLPTWLDANYSAKHRKNNLRRSEGV